MTDLTAVDEEELVSELRRRGYVFFLRKADIASACDQSKGLLTDDCVDKILEYDNDFETGVATVVTEYLEELLEWYDYEKGLEYA